MTDCFFVAVSAATLPEALQAMQTAINNDVKAYKQRLIDLGHRKESVDMLSRFDLQPCTIMPEMVPVHGGLLAAGTQQQFNTRYSIVTLVMVDYPVTK